MIKKISHIAVIVPDLDEAMKFWVEALGLALSHVEHVEDQAVDVAFLPAGESDIELLKPITEDSGVAKFLQKKGPGIHHICFEVEDISATLARLKEKGIQLINEEPTIGTGGKKIAFIHPKSTGGVLVELYELTTEEHWYRMESLDNMRQRISQGSRVYAAAFWGFVNGLYYGHPEENGSQNGHVVRERDQ
jgi:methylmalonyl-CoA/ethylmalonyl-CoA epimerase